MGCGTCGGSKSGARATTTLWQLKTADGRIKKYGSRQDAMNAQKRLGGTVTSVRR